MMPSAYYILDTSVLVEFLGVPGMRNSEAEIQNLFLQKRRDDESFLLPIATIIETGNHIAHIKEGQGSKRYDCSQKLITIVQNTFQGEGAFAPMNYISRPIVENWLTSFGENVESGVGIGDAAIITEFESQKNKLRQRLYIWSLDKHLAGYDTHPSLA